MTETEARNLATVLTIRDGIDYMIYRQGNASVWNVKPRPLGATTVGYSTPCFKCGAARECGHRE